MRENFHLRCEAGRKLVKAPRGVHQEGRLAMVMERERRYLSLLLAFVAAVTLVSGSVRAAQSGPDIVRYLLSLNLAHAVSDMSGAIMLVVVALVSGTCAILIAPYPGVKVYRIVQTSHQMGHRNDKVRLRRAFPDAAQTHAPRRDDQHAPRKSHAPTPAAATANGREKAPQGVR